MFVISAQYGFPAIRHPPSSSHGHATELSKLGVYAEFGVEYVWLVEPLDQLIEILRLAGDSYKIAHAATGDEPVRLPPFDAIEFPLSALWAR